MTIMTGTYDTPHASKYLQQLCKHFRHKVAASYDEKTGNVALPCGETIMTATDTTLIVKIDLKTAGSEKQGKYIIDSHLKDFAYREDFTEIDWVLSET